MSESGGFNINWGDGDTQTSQEMSPAQIAEAQAKLAGYTIKRAADPPSSGGGAPEQSTSGLDAAAIAAARRLVAGYTTSSRKPARAERVSSLRERVIEAAKGTAVINTDTPSGTLGYSNGPESKSRGFGVFGDGTQSGSYIRPDWHNPASPPPCAGGERIDRFNPVYTDASGKTFVPDMVEATGMTRVDGLPGKKAWDYVFDPNMRDVRTGDPTYFEMAGDRSGNYLGVRVVLPELLADELEDEIRAAAEANDFSTIRDIVGDVVVELGGVPASWWQPNGEPDAPLHGMRPPYEGVPDTHRVFWLEEQRRVSDNHPIMTAAPIGQPVPA